MEANIEVVVSATATGSHSALGNGNPADKSILQVATHYPPQVVHVGEGPAHGCEKEDAAIRMLVDEDVVEAAGKLRFSDAGDLTDLAGVREPRHVQHYSAKIRIRSAPPELERLHHVVAVVPLEVLDVHPAPAEMQVLVFDPPTIDHLEVLGIGERNDVEPLRPCFTVDHPCHVRVGTVEFLLDVHVSNRKRRTQGKVSHHLDIVASALHRVPGNLLLRKQCGWEGTQCQKRHHPNKRTIPLHYVTSQIGVSLGGK